MAPRASTRNHRFLFPGTSAVKGEMVQVQGVCGVTDDRQLGPASHNLEDSRSHADARECLRLGSLIGEVAVDHARAGRALCDQEMTARISRIVNELNIDRCTLLQYREADDVFVPVSSASATDPADTPSPPYQDLCWATAPLSRQEVLVYSRVEDMPREAHSYSLRLQNRGAKSVAIVPLFDADRLIGALELARVAAYRQWSPEIVQGLRRLGELIAAMLNGDPAGREPGQVEGGAPPAHRRLMRASRHAGLRNLLANMVHEISQPLSAIKAYAQAAGNHLQGKAQDTEQALNLLDKIAEQADWFDEAVVQFKGLLETRRAPRSIVDINKLTVDTLRLAEIRTQLGGCRVEVKVEHGLAPVRVNRIQVQQVLVNLIHNAVDAMSGLEEARLRVVGVRTRSRHRGEVVVSVSDQGDGVPSGLAARIFDPFYTTREAGTGMGLFICRAILEAHGGRIDHRPNPRGGTVFEFTLPAVCGDG